MARTPGAEEHEPLSSRALGANFEPRHRSFNIQADKETPPNKRRRVPIACRECRGRKSRCNGARPACSTCQSTRATCIYEQPAFKSSYVPSTGAELPMESRMRALEEKIDSLSRVQSYPQAPFGGFLRSDSAQRFDAEDDQRGFFHGGSQTNRGERDAAAMTEDVDGMCTLDWAEDENTTRIFGLSSNISLFRKVTHAAVLATNVNISFASCHPIAGSGSYQQNPASSSFSPLDTSIPRNMRRTTGNDITPEVPSESEANILIRQYFANAGLMTPCVHEESFLTMYEQARQEGFQSSRLSWLALMNMIFALASRLMHVCTPLPRMVDEAEIYYQRALRLVSLDMLVTTSLELVQVLLLMESFLQGTQSSLQIWTFHALAVKGALQLGLHSTELSKRLTPLNQEIRKRTWFWCVVNDRMHSAMFGQPPMIPGNDISLELPTDIDRDFQPENITSSTVLTGVTIYNNLISLSGIMGEAVEQLYNRNLDSQKSISFSEVIIRKCRLSQKIFEWQRSLPQNLQVISSSEILNRDYDNLETARFRGFLTLLYLGVRTLIIRPIVLEFLDVRMDSQSSDYTWTLLQGSGLSDLKECIEVCTETISLVGSFVSSYEKGINLICVWWLSTYYTFNASLIISAVLLASNKPKVSNLISPAFAMSMRTSLSQAEEVLEGLDNGHVLISRCRASLKRLLGAYDSLCGLNLLTPSFSTTSWPINERLSQEECHLDSRVMPATIDPNFQSLDQIDTGEFSQHW